jgi:hypothetical protein
VVLLLSHHTFLMGRQVLHVTFSTKERNTNYGDHIYFSNEGVTTSWIQSDQSDTNIRCLNKLRHLLQICLTRSPATLQGGHINWRVTKFWIAFPQKKIFDCWSSNKRKKASWATISFWRGAVLNEMQRNPPITEASGNKIFFALQAGSVSYRYLKLGSQGL